MTINTDHTTEAKILAAANKIFMQKGFAAARMQEVADEANINKALLHYYFRSKDKLFQAVLITALQNVFESIGRIFESDAPFFEKIEQFVDFYIEHIAQRPYLPTFVITEINREPKYAQEFINSLKSKPNTSRLFQQINTEVKKGTIKEIDPRQFFINLFSLCIFPFVAKPMIQNMLGISDKAYRQIIQQRKSQVSKFIIDALKK